MFSQQIDDLGPIRRKGHGSLLTPILVVLAGLFVLFILLVVIIAQSVPSTLISPEVFGVGSANFEPAWSPDGNRIAYVTGSRECNIVGECTFVSAICVMDQDGDNKDRVLGSSLGEVAAPDWTPDGKGIVYELSGSTVTFNLGGSSQSYKAAGGYPAVSPNGALIAYVSGGSVYVANPDGLEDSQVTQGGEPAWSPDGKRIALSLGGEIYTVNLDGSDRTPLTRGEAPDWSPDGSRIVFSRPTPIGSLPGIVAINRDGSQEQNLTRSIGDFDPAWSPDGTKIAFKRGDDIYVMKSNGSGLKRLARGSEQCGDAPGG
jgi:Tol biopolymer transport system component